MSNDVVINIDHVSKKYCKSVKHSMLYGVDDIGRNLFGLSSHSENLRADEFWAVDDVSFELRKGETIGIIGRNGSGKSTLLKMLNGIFWPDKGKITIKGRVGALIEVGAGFHPLLTGRENVYLNGAILGMTKAEVNAKFDDIVEFADIGDFIDVPVKSYSSGMYVRLGFAVAVHSSPDILLVDEVLAVGDRDFQIKCFRKMHELKKDNNISIVMVTHNEYNLREYTERSAVLDKGKLLFIGQPDEAISAYVNKSVDERMLDSSIEKEIGKEIVTKITFKNINEEETKFISTGDLLIIDFEYDFKQKIQNPIIGIVLSNSQSPEFASFWNSCENFVFPEVSGKGKARIIVDPCDLPVDDYQCSVVVCDGEESNVLEWRDTNQRLIVHRKYNVRGNVRLRQVWEVLKS